MTHMNKITTVLTTALLLGHLPAALCKSHTNSHPEYALYFSAEGFPIAPDSEVEPRCADTDAPQKAGWTVIKESCFKDEYVPRILNGFATSGKQRILLFVHGGLNSLNDARERVDRLVSAGEGPGTLREKHYPIFINWQASFISSYKDHLFRVRQGVGEPKTATLTSPYIFVKDLVFGAFKTAPDTIELFYNLGEKIHPEPVCLSEAAPEEYAVTKSRFCRESETRIRIGHDLRTRASRIGSYTKAVVWSPIKPLTTGFVIDGFGSEAWKIMIRRTELMFHRELFPPADPRDTDPRSLTFFLQRLAAAAPDSAGTSIDFVAHSAGAIILNRALREVPELPVDNIVYMAAASSEEDYESTMIGNGKQSGYLSNHPDTRVFHLVLQPNAETNESYLGLFELTPRGSLLYWIDNFLADPEFSRDHVAGRATNLMPRIDATPSEVKKRVLLKIFDYGALQQAPPSHPTGQRLREWYDWCDHHRASCQPQRHGDFSEMPFWQEWFWCPHWDTPGGRAVCRVEEPPVQDQP